MEIIEIGKSDSQKSWLKECITPYKDLCEFGGYRTLKNLTLVIDNIEEIGTITRLYKSEYVDGSFICVQVENKEKKFLVSLGSNSVTEKQRVALKKGEFPEQRLLRAIFGAENSITQEQEHFWHREYICEINSSKDTHIEDVVFLMASIASRSACRKTKIRTKSKIYYLSDSFDICECSLEEKQDLYNENYNLNVSFYKIEPIGCGLINIKPLRALDNESLDFNVE